MDSVDSDAQHLLGLIVRAAQLDAHQHTERHDLLRQASALLWWLEPGSPPRTIANLLSCLSLPLEQWLDNRFRQGYQGALQFADEPTMLCNAIALETNPRAGWERVQQIVKNVRDLCRTRLRGDDEYRLFRMFLIEHGVVDADRSLDFLIPLQVSFNSLYEPIPQHLIRMGQVYLCPSCGWPMEIHRRTAARPPRWHLVCGPALPCRTGADVHFRCSPHHERRSRQPIRVWRLWRRVTWIVAWTGCRFDQFVDCPAAVGRDRRGECSGNRVDGLAQAVPKQRPHLATVGDLRCLHDL